jgi:hypothetical protein
MAILPELMEATFLIAAVGCRNERGRGGGRARGGSGRGGTHMLLLVKEGVASMGKKEPTPSASMVPIDEASVSALLAVLQGGSHVSEEEGR